MPRHFGRHREGASLWRSTYSVPKLAQAHNGLLRRHQFLLAITILGHAVSRHLLQSATNSYEKHSVFNFLDENGHFLSKKNKDGLKN